MKVSKILKDFCLLIGDTTDDSPKDFLIAGLNWALRDLPTNPKLSKLFSHHLMKNLDAKGHFKWDLGGEDTDGGKPYFDRIMDISYLNFWSSTGGSPCRMDLCQVTPGELYSKGLPSIQRAGKPCQYALEREEDKLYLVLDRPSDVPIILDYIAYGIPREVEDLNDNVPISKLCENAILDILKVKFYQEAEDMNFSGQVYDYLDNRYIPQLLQEIYKKMEFEVPYIMGS